MRQCTEGIDPNSLYVDYKFDCLTATSRNHPWL